MGRYITPSGSTTGIASTSVFNYLPAARRAPFTNRCIYDLPGTYCFTVPSGVCSIRVVTLGAGGSSCRRISPDAECLRPLECSNEVLQVVCGHDGFIYKFYNCIKPLSSCQDYCSCFCCGTCLNLISCCSTYTSTCLSQSTNYCIFPRFVDGVAGAGTTLCYESCYMSGQSIVAPSGGYADGCLSVTPGCSFTVTVGCAGGSSGFGTYISATGGSVAITQRPVLRCHFLNNACYLFCAFDTGGSLVSAAATNLSAFPSSCSLILADTNTCFVHYYENQCAQATLTPGIGTAWEGMSNVIIRSGAAGTIFHPEEYSFSGTITGNCLTNLCSACCFLSCECNIIGFTSTSNTICWCCHTRCLRFGPGAYCTTGTLPTISNNSPSYLTSRSFGGSSAGNYFGNGIAQHEYDISCCCVTCFDNLNGYSGCGTCITNFIFGPLLTCCGLSAIPGGVGCTGSCVCVTSPAQFFRYCCGAPGGAGIKSPGTICLAGSGRVPCECAFSCTLCSGQIKYLPTDDINGPLDIICWTPCAACGGTPCCSVAPNTIFGSDYWYPEDICGHSNISYVTCGYSVNFCGYPGAGGTQQCLLFKAGIMGGSLVKYCVSGCHGEKQSICCASNFNRVCGGGTIGFEDANVSKGGCIFNSQDSRCLNWTSGMVIVYY